MNLNLESSEDIEYPTTNLVVLLLFCGYVIIWYLQIGNRIPRLGEMRFEFIYAALLTLIMIGSIWRLSISCPLIRYVGLYILVLIIQIPFSHDFDTSWNVFIDRIVKFAFMAVFIVAFVKQPTHVKFFLGSFLLACMKMGQEGFLGQITGSLSWQNQGIMRLHGPTPFYRHPNSFSGMALGTIPFILHLFPISRKVVKIVLLIQFIFAANIVLFTGSRTGYVAFLGLIFYILLKSKNKKRFFTIAIIITAVGISFIPDEYKGRFESIFTGKQKEGRSIDKRKEILTDAWNIFLENPFGIGVGAFPAVRTQKYGRSQDTHNLYLEVATNLGVQGFIIFVLFVYKMLNMLKYLQNSFELQIKKLNEIKSVSSVNEAVEKHLNDITLMKATCDAVSAFIILRLLLGLFGMDLYEIYWWFSLGLTIASFEINIISHKKTEAFISSASKRAGI